MCMFRLLLFFAVLLSSIVALGQGCKNFRVVLKELKIDYCTTTKSRYGDVTELRSPDTGITYVSLSKLIVGVLTAFLMLLGRSVSPKGYIQFTLDEPCSNIKLLQ